MSDQTALTQATTKITVCSVIGAIVLVLLGGVGYLSAHSQVIVDYSHFHAVTLSQHYLITLWYELKHFSGAALISAGLMVLIGGQLLRVLAITGFFIGRRDYPFIIISLIVTIILLFSLTHF